MKPEPIRPPVGELPPSALGPDGKFLQLSEEERREHLESARRRLQEIAEIPDDPNDPPDEVWMRGIDEMRPHRPQFQGMSERSEDSMKAPETHPIQGENLPPSGLGPDGKLRRMTDEEHRQYIESARRRLREIAEIPDDPNDPPDEVWMRGIDEMRPHRPLFQGYY
jgi:hypothetical protein